MFAAIQAAETVVPKTDPAKVDAAKAVRAAVEATKATKAAPKNSTLVDETIAELDELLEYADDAGPSSSVEFSSEEKVQFKRLRSRKGAEAWGDNSYRDFEAVEVLQKGPIEHGPDDALFFEEQRIETRVSKSAAPSQPSVEPEVQLGQPGMVFPEPKTEPSATDNVVDHLAELVGENDQEAVEITIENKTDARLEPVNPTDGATEDIEEDAFVDNAKEIQRRLVVDDESAPPIQTGDRWYVPSEGLTHVELGRRERIRECLEFYYSRMLNTRDDSPWSMMHHMIAWGTDSRIWIGPPGGRNESCIGWLCANGACEGERLLYVKNGLLKARTGPGLQGHEGQFLAMLAQTRVRADQPIQVNGELYTVKDLIRQEQLGCRPGTELTFKLIGLVHYLDTDAAWISSDGQQWDIQRLIREEMRQPINGTTCGGTHRLMGMTYAIRRREQEGKPVDGEFQRAVIFTERYQRMAYDMQNANGTFSSDFWRSRGNWGDLDRKLKTTGHILEWMVFSKSHQELNDSRMLAAVDWLTQMMTDNRYYDFEKGPLGHGVRALSLYDERVYGGVPGKRGYEVAAAPPRLIARNPATKALNKPPGASMTPTPQRTQRRGGGIFGAFRRR